jgi:hypothetical protein
LAITWLRPRSSHRFGENRTKKAGRSCERPAPTNSSLAAPS